MITIVEANGAQPEGHESVLGCKTFATNKTIWFGQFHFISPVS